MKDTGIKLNPGMPKTKKIGILYPNKIENEMYTPTKNLIIPIIINKSAIIYKNRDLFMSFNYNGARCKHYEKKIMEHIFVYYTNFFVFNLFRIF